MLERLEPTKNNILHIANNIMSSYFRSKFLKFACACLLINLNSNDYKIVSYTIRKIDYVAKEIIFTIIVMSPYSCEGWKAKTKEDVNLIGLDSYGTIVFSNLISTKKTYWITSVTLKFDNNIYFGTFFGQNSFNSKMKKIFENELNKKIK